MSPVSLVFHTIVTWDWSQICYMNKDTCSILLNDSTCQFYYMERISKVAGWWLKWHHTNLIFISPLSPPLLVWRHLWMFSGLFLKRWKQIRESIIYSWPDLWKYFHFECVMKFTLHFKSWIFFSSISWFSSSCTFFLTIFSIRIFTKFWLTNDPILFWAHRSWITQMLFLINTHSVCMWTLQMLKTCFTGSVL